MGKASRAVASAKLLLDAGDVDGACNRAYYAMFDAAHAALLTLAKRSTRWSASDYLPTTREKRWMLTGDEPAADTLAGWGYNWRSAGKRPRRTLSENA